MLKTPLEQEEDRVDQEKKVACAIQRIVRNKEIYLFCVTK